MRKRIILFLLYTVTINTAERVEIIVTTKISIEQNQAERLMLEVHQECKTLSKKYLLIEGVKSVETEVENQTITKKCLQ